MCSSNNVKPAHLVGQYVIIFFASCSCEIAFTCLGIALSTDCSLENNKYLQIENPSVSEKSP